MAVPVLPLLFTGFLLLAGAGALRQAVQSPSQPHDLEPLLIQLQPSPTLRPAVSKTPLPTAEDFMRARLDPSAKPTVASSAVNPMPMASASSTPGAPSPSVSPTLEPQALPSGPLPLQQLHAEAIVVDAHIDTPLKMVESNIGLAGNNAEVDIPKLRAGGVDVVIFSIFVSPYRYAKVARSQADFMIKNLKQQVTANNKQIQLAYSFGDIQRIHEQGKIAGIIGLEGADPLEGKLTNLDYFYKQGVRYIGLTWSTHTALADSSSGAPKWNGLSPLGKQVVQRMNELGMVIDVSHLSDKSFYDVIKTSKAPVMASHSSARALQPSPRNLNDDMLRNLAKNGGVVGAIFYPPFLAKGPTSTQTVVDHIDHMVKVAGIGAVGLGSDFDGLDIKPPVGLENASKFPNITAELRKRGYSDEDIRKVLGGNLMRVFEQVLR
jgi:membrane dipeptidase